MKPIKKGTEVTVAYTDLLQPKVCLQAPSFSNFVGVSLFMNLILKMQVDVCAGEKSNSVDRVS